MPKPIDSPVSTSKQQACALSCVIFLTLLIAGCDQAAREAARQVEPDVAFTSTAAETDEQSPEIGTGIDRKIIYTAEVKLVVRISFQQVLHSQLVGL